MPGDVYQAQPEFAAKLTTDDLHADADAADVADTDAHEVVVGSPRTRRSRTITNTAEIDSTIIHPGSVRINVKGAFIVDTQEPSTPVNGSGQTSSSYHETKDIRLPNHTAVVSHIAVDVSFATRPLLFPHLPTPRADHTPSPLRQIGGSLAKLVYFSREAHSTEPGGRLNFMNFETDRIDDCVEFMKHLKDKQLALNGSRSGELYVMATGGGAYKFYDKIREALEVDVLREDEMECLIIGEL